MCSIFSLLFKYYNLLIEPRNPVPKRLSVTMCLISGQFKFDLEKSRLLKVK